MRIPDDTLDAIKAATDIVEVVSDYVELRRVGSNFRGLCPFHKERTPSFNVNPALGIFKCFGCGEAGDAIAFVQKVEGVGFVEAVRHLAERAGIELPEEGGPADEAASERETLYHALRFAARFYYRQLTQTEEGRTRALPYVRRRGFTAETVRRFGLGYAPNRWDALLRAATEAQIKPEVLERAGLVLPRRQGGYYDRFRGRLLFPILSHVGKVLGFGGRLLAEAPDQPKYVNSPETAVYHKGRVLYGLYQARHAIRAEQEAILVEGYTDVIALHQAGIAHVVAASGTALTAEQVRLLARYARRILLLFDADAAGVAAALRSVDLILREGLVPYVVTLPDRTDPDSFVRRVGPGAFRDYLREHRRSFVAFMTAAARQAGRLDTPEGRMEVAREVFHAIAQIPAEPHYYVMWEGYVQAAAKELGVPDMYLRQQFPDLVRWAAAEAPPPRPRAPDGEPPESSHRSKVRPEEEALIRLMLTHGMPMVEHVLGHMALEEFTKGAPRALVAALLEQYEAGRIDREVFLRGAHGEEVRHLAASALVVPHAPSRDRWQEYGIPVPEYDEDPYETAASAMKLLRLDRLDEAIQEQLNRQYQAEQAGEDPRPYVEAIKHLQKVRREVERLDFLKGRPPSA